MWPGVDHTGHWRSGSVLLFYPESHKKKRNDRIWLEVFEKPTLAHSGEQVGKLEKHYPFEGGCWAGLAEVSGVAGDTGGDKSG